MNYALALENAIVDNFDESFLKTLKRIPSQELGKLALMKFNRLTLSDRLDVIGEIMADRVGTELLGSELTPANCSINVCVDLSLELTNYFIKFIEEDLEDAHTIYMHENGYIDAAKEHLLADLAQRVRDYNLS